MSEAYFESLGAGSYRPGDATRGPWSPDLMHGGPPSALLAHEMLRAPPSNGVPESGLLARITVEFLAAIPVADLEVDAAVERAGRRVALLSGRLSVAGRPVALARAWLLRTDDLPVPPTDRPRAPEPGTPMDQPPAGWGGGYLESVAWSWVSGSMGRPGPGTVWADPQPELVAGRETTAVERMLLVADSGSGVSAAADLRQWSFTNTELSVHLFRPPQPGPIWIDCATVLDPCGVGLATSVLGDSGGAVGRAEQTLFVARRRPPADGNGG